MDHLNTRRGQWEQVSLPRGPENHWRGSEVTFVITGGNKTTKQPRKVQSPAPELAPESGSGAGPRVQVLSWFRTSQSLSSSSSRRFLKAAAGAWRGCCYENNKMEGGSGGGGLEDATEESIPE